MPRSSRSRRTSSETFGISLLVGGIGVMNIMLITVTNCRRMSRRRAPSALRTPISRVRSVTEAIIVCLIGGLIGVVPGTVYFGLVAEVSPFSVLFCSRFGNWGGTAAGRRIRL